MVIPRAINERMKTVGQADRYGEFYSPFMTSGVVDAKREK